MAERKGNKKLGVVGMELPECPVCFEVMSAPIFNCSSGHSLCADCNKNLCPAICPICRAAMTQMRNITLEEIISKAKVSCPNKANGCVYTMSAQNIQTHLKECIFREMPCPIGTAFGTCLWRGLSKDMLDHFKDRHPENCQDTDSDIELSNMSIAVDKHYVFLVPKANLLFILTVKIDTIQKVAYWIVQHIGSKFNARQHVYEIHVCSKQNSERKVTFSEYCFNDNMKTEEIFCLGRCSMMPLTMLNHFITDNKIFFQLSTRRIYGNPNQVVEKVEGDQAPSEDSCSSRPRGPRPRSSGPRRQGPRGRGSGPGGPRGRGQPKSKIS